MRVLLFTAWLVGCGGSGQSAPETAALRLEGPLDVTVDQLGPVDGPAIMLGDEAAPTEGLQVRVQPESVATVGADGRVRAIAPGEAEVTVVIGEQEASWRLVVAPPVTLVLRNPPATIPIGRPTPLHVEARAGSTSVDPGVLSWTSSDESILRIEEGLLVGVAPGIAFVTVSDGGGHQAMVELEVSQE